MLSFATAQRALLSGFSLSRNEPFNNLAIHNALRLTAIACSAATNITLNKLNSYMGIEQADYVYRTKTLEY